MTHKPAKRAPSIFSAHILVTVLWLIGLISTTKFVYDVNKGFTFVDQDLNPKSFAALSWLKNYDKSQYYVNIGGGVIYWDWTPAAYSLEMPVINFLYSRHLRTQDVQRREYSPFIAQAKYQISLPDQAPPPNAQQIKEFEGVFVWYVPDILPYAFSTQPALLQKYTKLQTDQVSAVTRVYINGPNQIVVKATPKQAGDVLVVLMSNYPGWKLLIDGKPAQVTPFNDYLGSKMPPGEHLYIFYFLPTAFIVGAIISLIAFVVLVLIFLKPLIRNRPYRFNHNFTTRHSG